MYMLTHTQNGYIHPLRETYTHTGRTYAMR